MSVPTSYRGGCHLWGPGRCMDLSRFCGHWMTFSPEPSTQNLPRSSHNSCPVPHEEFLCRCWFSCTLFLEIQGGEKIRRVAWRSEGLDHLEQWVQSSPGKESCRPSSLGGL